MIIVRSQIIRIMLSTVFCLASGQMLCNPEYQQETADSSKDSATVHTKSEQTQADLDDLFTPLDDGLPKPDFTPPSRIMVFLRHYGILALDYSTKAAQKCCGVKGWLKAHYYKTVFALKQLRYTL